MCGAIRFRVRAQLRPAMPSPMMATLAVLPAISFLKYFDREGLTLREGLPLTEHLLVWWGHAQGRSVSAVGVGGRMEELTYCIFVFWCASVAVFPVIVLSFASASPFSDNPDCSTSHHS